MSNKKVYLILLFSILVQLYCFIVVLEGPIVGIEVKKSDDGKWYVSNVQENNWGSLVNIELSTELIEVDGVPLSNIGESKITINQADSITFLHNGDFKKVDINYRGMEFQLIKHFIIPLVYALLSIGLSVYLILNSQNYSRLLIYHLQFTALAYTSAGAAGRGDYFSNIVVSLTLFLSVVYLMLYCNLLLKTINKTFEKKVNLFIVSVSIALIAINIVRYFVDGILYIQVTFELIVLLCLLCIFIKNMVTALKNNVFNAKPLLLIFLLGFGPFFLLYGVPIIFNYSPVLTADVAALFLLIIPTCLFYLEYAERLISFQYAFDRMFVHLKIALPFSVILAFILMLFTKQISVSQFSFFFLMIFIALIILLYLKESIEVKSSRYIITSEYYTLLDFYNFIKSSSKISDIASLIEHIKNELSLILKISLKNIKIIKVNLLNSNVFMELNNLQEVSKNLIYKNNSEYVIVLHENNEARWIAIVQIENGRFPSESLKMLELFLNYIHNMMDNFLKLEEILNLLAKTDNVKISRWYSKIWINSTERERRRLSAEIHDTILQDLIQLSRGIEELVINQHESNEKSKVMCLHEEVLDIIDDTRDICEYLYPPMLERFGLIRSLEELVNKNKIRFNALIKDDFEDIDLSLQQSTTIYRIIQELLSNANKHSQATVIHISLKLKDSKIVIDYSDDGVGINPEFQFDEVKTMGLLGIRERIKYYGGNLDIKNKSDSKGLQIRVDMNVGDSIENNDFG
ncbi:ATP-binding protein [Ureibacillus thermosphaericus]|uniref:ATP-binding protein n=1 Tax=Ureibacillus thermosphaericus TaxID=51173 RepID=UPI000BBC5948|nr:ATP-binding protein [Ureibacillus thermosphaericus]